MLRKVYQLLDEHFDNMVKIRRHLHQYPELSFQEVKTARFIADFYKERNIPVRTGVGGNGVVAKIKGKNPGKTVALRADFDALPIQEENDLPYKSKVPGVMHACGHDGHTSTLLNLAHVLNEVRDNLAGEYVLIHQHAEEYAPGGALPMIEDGCLEGVDVIFGTHLWATDPLGQIGYRSGAIMAAPDYFKITIQGKGGHGAEPHQTNDAIVAASQLVINLQQVVSRRIDPLQSAVVSIGSFMAKNAFNIIADKVELEGTVRTFSESVRQKIEQEMEQIIKGTCLANNCTYTFDYQHGYPAVINHPKETEFLRDCAKSTPDVKNVIEIEPRMAGEDFAYYLQHVKGSFFFTGARPQQEKVYPHHHPRFNFDERAMLIAAKTLATAAINYQKVEG